MGGGVLTGVCLTLFFFPLSLCNPREGKVGASKTRNLMNHILKEFGTVSRKWGGERRKE